MSLFSVIIIVTWNISILKQFSSIIITNSCQFRSIAVKEYWTYNVTLKSVVHGICALAAVQSDIGRRQRRPYLVGITCLFIFNNFLTVLNGVLALRSEVTFTAFDWKNNNLKTSCLGEFRTKRSMNVEPTFNNTPFHIFLSKICSNMKMNDANLYLNTQWSR